MRVFLICLLALWPASACAQETRAETHTQWEVTSAEGMDALLLIGAAGGDVMQADIYPEEIAWVRDNISSEGLEAIDEIDAALRQRIGVLTGPSMAYFFSANEVETLDDVIASAADPRGRLQPGLMNSPHWDAARFDNAVRLMPIIHTALTELREAGFSNWYAANYADEINAALAVNRAGVEPYDIIPEQEWLLGRALDPQIEILIASFSKPYGIRIMGQRFIAYHGWEAETQLRVAAHEIFHPPFDPNDTELLDLLSDLEADPWMQSIVNDHNPQYGYNSFMGVINEGSTQALDQIVSDRLGFGRETGARWRDADGGMHMFAAAAWHAMVEDGFANEGGVYSDWLKSALRRGLLSPSEVRRRATEVVGAETVDQWGPHRGAD